MIEIFSKTLKPSYQNSKSKDYNFGLRLYKIEISKHQNLTLNLICLLSSDELDRANRYHFLKDKSRFIISKSFLKFLLAQYIDIPINEIILALDSNKKPYLPTHPSVYFNVSHSGDYAIIAIAKSPIGVDIEYINEDFDFNEILPSVFNMIEMNQVDTSNDRHRTFYKFWTRKEAIVKAIGKGIDDDITRIPVTDGTHSIPRSLVVDDKKITVFSFNLNDDYIGALALTDDIHDFQKIMFYPLPTSDELKVLISS